MKLLISTSDIYVIIAIAFMLIICILLFLLIKIALVLPDEPFIVEINDHNQVVVDEYELDILVGHKIVICPVCDCKTLLFKEAPTVVDFPTWVCLNHSCNTNKVILTDILSANQDMK